MADKEGWVAILAVVAFLAILVAWNFVTDVWNSMMVSVGAQAGVPGSISALVFLGAIAVAIVIYLKGAGEL